MLIQIVTNSHAEIALEFRSEFLFIRPGEVRCKQYMIDVMLGRQYYKSLVLLVLTFYLLSMIDEDTRNGK